jgi:tRNA-Thr(GGU) m(6)t(6)A37 methyltransferase TsaA
MRFLRRREKPFERPAPPAEVALRAIGYVRNDVVRPQPRGWEKVESRIELLPEYANHVLNLGRYSHMLVVFYMDIAEGAPDKPSQLTLESGHTYGIFATRSQVRPNHLGVSTVALLTVEGTILRVKGLDAVDGTPVLDIKPYLPEYDSVPGARIP